MEPNDLAAGVERHVEVSVRADRGPDRIVFDRRAPENVVPACSQVDSLDVASGRVLYERGAVLDDEGNVALDDNGGRGRMRGKLSRTAGGCLCRRGHPGHSMWASRN